MAITPGEMTNAPLSSVRKSVTVAASPEQASLQLFAAEAERGSR